MIFEWNPEKAKINLSKHNVSFEEASTVFGDPLSDTFDDPEHSAEENRFIHHRAFDKRKIIVCFTHRRRGNC